MSIPPARDSPGFDRAIELFLEDMFSLGRLTTDHSIAEYRRTVRKHAEDAGDARPDATTREQVKQTLRRWSHLAPLEGLPSLLPERLDRFRHADMIAQRRSRAKDTAPDPRATA